MTVVDYDFEYAFDTDGKRYPRLSFEIACVAKPSVSLDIEAYLDLGAERSLFNGLIGAMLDIDMQAGTRLYSRR